MFNVCIRDCVLEAKKKAKKQQSLSALECYCNENSKQFSDDLKILSLSDKC